MSGRSTIRGVKLCAQWLAYCLSIGWKKSDLDALEKLWWKCHKLDGTLRERRDQPAEGKKP